MDDSMYNNDYDAIVLKIYVNKSALKTMYQKYLSL